MHKQTIRFMGRWCWCCLKMWQHITNCRCCAYAALCAVGKLITAFSLCTIYCCCCFCCCHCWYYFVVAVESDVDVVIVVAVAVVHFFAVVVSAACCLLWLLLILPCCMFLASKLISAAVSGSREGGRLIGEWQGLRGRRNKPQKRLRLMQIKQK